MSPNEKQVFDYLNNPDPQASRDASRENMAVSVLLFKLLDGLDDGK